MGIKLSTCCASDNHSIGPNNVNSGITNDRPQPATDNNNHARTHRLINSGRGSFYAALPPEMIAIIAKYSDVGTLKNMRLANKEFEGVAAHEIKHVKVSNGDELRGALKAFGADRGGLEKITLGSDIKDGDLAELQRIPGLKHLVLKDCRKVTGRALANLRHVPALTHLNAPPSTTDRHLQEYLKKEKVPNLKYLDLSSCRQITEAGMAPVRREGLEIVSPVNPIDFIDAVSFAYF